MTQLSISPRRKEVIPRRAVSSAWSRARAGGVVEGLGRLECGAGFGEPARVHQKETDVLLQEAPLEELGLGRMGVEVKQVQLRPQHGEPKAPPYTDRLPQLTQ
jgi:hypothetical protein